MLVQNFRHEFRLLSRSYWFPVLSVLFVLLCVYAGFNGTKLYEARSAELIKAKADQKVLVDRVYGVARAVENGEEPDNMYRLSPMNMSIATGSLAFMSTDPLSALAVGQSDLYTHQVRISSREDLATLTFTEMSNPVQLLFGNFDVSFVLTYLIPLVIIAFTYNLQSQELESGRLKLLASNPIDPKMWLLQRYLTRLISLCIILSFALLLTLFLLNIPFSMRLAGMTLLTFAYTLFWFAVSFVVNVFGTSSAKNAVILLMTWIVLVLIIPAAINQTASTVYPTPSRVTLLNEIRQTKKDLGKEQDKVLAAYLRNHPELARAEGENRFAYWQGFFASQEIMENSLSPLVQQFDEQVQEQQNWISTWRFLSPAVLFQTSFTELAGTSSKQYNHFKNGVRNYTKNWRDHFIPMVFDNRMLTFDDLEVLPAFEYTAMYDQQVTRINMLALLGISMVLLISGFRKQHLRFQM
ncbi:MAG: DUF3526 domain-containing protein [Bacteroidota bacterium]